MRNPRLLPLLFGLTAATALLGGCRHDGDSQPTVGAITFALDNRVGTQPLALDGTAYTTPGGETFTVSTFKYYVSNIQLTKAELGRTEYTMNITSAHCNKGKNLHGGMACIILDNLTSTALLTLAKPGFLDAGHVSRTITMSYVRPVPIGSKATIVCEVVAAGRNTANLKGEIQVDGKTCVTCIHDKVVFKRGEVHPKQKDHAKAKL